MESHVVPQVEGGISVLYEDPWLVVVNKPPGLFVHRSELDRREDDVVLTRVRDTMGSHVHPAHRLDRGVSGALLFARDRGVLAELTALFRERQVDKRYVAVVRGHMAGRGALTRPVDGKPAVTTFATWLRGALPYRDRSFTRTRLSFVALAPATGRHHQLRVHLAGAAHPILNDSTHGDTRQNRAFREWTGVSRLMLHAHTLAFTHPRTGAAVAVTAPFDAAFLRVWEALGGGAEGPAALPSSPI